MRSEQPKFMRTQRAALAEKTTKWDLIAAIAADAIENDLPITGTESQLAAKQALDAAGNEYADKTIAHLSLVAKFDHESTKQQRALWRTYGWTVVVPFAQRGISREAAAEYLGKSRRTWREVGAYLKVATSASSTPTPRISIDDAWKDWLYAINRVLRDGALLAERSEQATEQLGTYSALARLIYERITERKIDAEIRQFLDSVEADA